ncbi:hypothetical protein DFH09DRAFT_1284519 [Mycena vulgaris]|nr:hypothetical protein DFH09DRAFT_1284519 [Mycena vulgaris]
MATVSSSVLAFFLIAPLLASAAPSVTYPSHISGLPRDATHLALDEEARELVAFSRRGELLGRFAFSNVNGSNIGTPGNFSRRDVNGACVDMSSDDVQKCESSNVPLPTQVPGWNTLKSIAEKNWGTGSYNIVTNDKDYPNQPAQSCASTDQVKIVPDGKPSTDSSCSVESSKSDGEQVGTSGTITLTHAKGTSSTTTTTVTKEASIGIGHSFGVSVGFPEIADITSEFTFTATFTNTLSTANEKKTDQTHTEALTQNNSAGKECHLEFTTQTCTITGSGKVRTLGTGWVWFEYNDKTQGHYKWALSIDALLTNQDDRSTFIEFKSTTGTTSTSKYNGVCK